MGGSIAVTIREADGKEHRMCRWTNYLPYLVNNPRLTQKDKTLIEEYVEGWYAMVDDWKKHKIYRKFKYRMTEQYAPYPYLAPEDYGLLVIDMREDMILTMQGYTKIGKISAIFILLEIQDLVEGIKGDENSAIKRLEGFYNVKKIKWIYDRRAKRYNYRKYEKFEDILAMVKREDSNFLEFEIDMSPFTVIEYEENRKGAEDMLKKIKELGFNLSKTERDIWKEWINIEGDED